MTDSLERNALMALDETAKSETPAESEDKSVTPEVTMETGEASPVLDISVGDMETDLPKESEAAVAGEIEIPWGEATAPETATIEEAVKPAEGEAAPAAAPEGAAPSEEAPAEGPVEPTGPKPPYKRAWYVVHCYSGYENKVKKGLEQRINTMGMQDRIFRVVVPIEKEVEIKEGQRRNIERRVFPGYILVEMMELEQGEPVSDEAWYVVRNTPGVTGFVSSGDKPVPLREDEVTKILTRMESEEPKVHVTFRSGQTVHIIDGPFADFRGTVDNVDMTKGKVRVLVSFFGRETPVELDLLQVEKV